MEIEVKHLRFKHPFTSVVVGPTNSGKTYFIQNLLKNHSLVINNIGSSIRVLWFYGVYQSSFKIPISENVVIRYIEGIPKDNILSEFKPDLIVIDDLLFEFDKNKNVENIFIKNSHHLKISVVFAVQNLFYKSLRTISINSNYIILMKNPRDKQQIKYLAKQIFADNSKYLIEAYNDATKNPYGYLVIDLTADTPDEYRLRTRIYPDESKNIRFSPIIYQPK
jgi:septin family protein